MQTPKRVKSGHNKICYGMIGLLVVESYIINGGIAWISQNQLS